MNIRRSILLAAFVLPNFAAKEEQGSTDLIYWFEVKNLCTSPTNAILKSGKAIMITTASQQLPLCDGSVFCCALGYKSKDIDIENQRPKQFAKQTFTRYHD